MSRRLLWINPVGIDSYDKPISDALREEAFPDTRIDVCSLRDVHMQHLEYNAYEMVAAGPTIGAVRWGEENGYDAAVIGCFYDPFLRAAREVTQKMAVTAPAEACLHIANTLGERVSILVGRSKWIPEMHENVAKYGFADRLASFRVLEMTQRVRKNESWKKREKRLRKMAQMSLFLVALLNLGSIRKYKTNWEYPLSMQLSHLFDTRNFSPIFANAKTGE